MRYKISENIHISKVASTDRFLIKDDLSERQFFINQTTKIFIEKFSGSKTFAEINKEIAAEVNAPAQEIKKIIQPFFRYIKYRQFIVPENFSGTKTKARALFNSHTILDNYKIEKNLAVNGNIDIYKAIDLVKENVVVIKLLKQPKKQQAEELQREFNFLKNLNKTTVTPKTYRFITKEKYIYFVQDFIKGLSLPQFTRRKKRSAQKLVLHIIAEILFAFKTIHAENILHGDIHPSNIIVTPGNKIKIIDFGLAINNELDKDEIVNFGGAYFFMPPERIKKTTYKKFTRKPDFYSDVFQLGVVLYVLLYDNYPFNGITWEELATEIKEKEIGFPGKSQYNFPVPGWLKTIIIRCVAKNPKRRFANAQELYNDFLKNYTANGRKIRPAVKI